MRGAVPRSLEPSRFLWGNRIGMDRVMFVTSRSRVVRNMGWVAVNQGLNIKNIELTKQVSNVSLGVEAVEDPTVNEGAVAYPLSSAAGGIVRGEELDEQNPSVA